MPRDCNLRLLVNLLGFSSLYPIWGLQSRPPPPLWQSRGSLSFVTLNVVGPEPFHGVPSTALQHSGTPARLSPPLPPCPVLTQAAASPVPVPVT